MNRGVVVAVVVLVSVAAGGMLLAGDSGPGGALGATGGDATTTPGSDRGNRGTQTDSGGGEAGNSSDAADSTTTARDDSGYAFTILTVEKCGSTCRNVTARLDNTGGVAREDVRVTTKMYADDDLLWSGNETVGRLAPGESHTSTRRVDVGFSGGLAISANDGYVTIVTVVRSESGTARFSERRKVA